MSKMINVWLWDRPSRVADTPLQQFEFINSFSLPAGSGCSGSRQPTTNDFAYMLSNPEILGLGIALERKNIDTIIFFDLRKEPHLHTDIGPMGIASISLADNLAGIEDQMHHSNSILHEEDYIKKIIQKWPLRVYTEVKAKKNKDMPPVNKEATFNSDVFEFKMVQTEAEIISQLNNDPNKNYIDLEYYRLAIKDHGTPSVQEVEAFVQFAISASKSNTWVHFHCHGGKGRTSTFIAMYNLIYSRVHPDCGLNDFIILSNPKISYAGVKNKLDVGSGHYERVEFITNFRKYIEAISNDIIAGNPVQLWSDWLWMDIKKSSFGSRNKS